MRYANDFPEARPLVNTIDINSAETIGSRLANLEHQRFVGRHVECQAFTDALAPSNRNWQILNVWGPAGVGKSILLDEYQRIASSQDNTFIHLDTEELNGSPDTFFRTLCYKLELHSSDVELTLQSCIDTIRSLSGSNQVILAFDHYDEAGQLNSWLREDFLPQLPPQCLIVIASRHPLEEWWGGNPTWNQLIRPIRLNNFNSEETSLYLLNHGVENTRMVKQVWHYTDGLPLALSLVSSIIEREGTKALEDIPKRPDIIQKLVQYWHKEISDDGLNELVEAASIVRRFNLELLNHLTQKDIDEALYERLTSTSFVKINQHGWVLHDLVRETLSRNFKNRTPTEYNNMRARALAYYGQLATKKGNELERGLALQELFYMLGDGLVRAALYDQQELENDNFYIETATPADFTDLEEYIEEWREKSNTLTGTKVELYDREKQSIDPQWVAKEPCEPELINLTDIIINMPGAVKLLRDTQNYLRGLSVILPVNKFTEGWLSGAPVTRNYINSASLKQETLDNNFTDTERWFVRLIDVRDGEDNAARSAIFRELTGLLIRPVQFITSTPLPFYQSLLTRFGFVQMDIPAHNDFGSDRAAPYFSLDLRGENFVNYIRNMISLQTGDEALQALSPELANMIAVQAQKATQEEPSKGRTELLKPLTSREKEVALSAVEGLANCSIAAKLGVTEVTIKKHMSRIFEKLNVRDRRELIKTYWSQ